MRFRDLLPCITFLHLEVRPIVLDCSEPVEDCSLYSISQIVRRSLENVRTGDSGVTTTVGSWDKMPKSTRTVNCVDILNIMNRPIRRLTTRNNSIPSQFDISMKTRDDFGATQFRLRIQRYTPLDCIPTPSSLKKLSYINIDMSQLFFIPFDDIFSIIGV